VTEHHVAVIDGSTSKSAVQMDKRMKNGRLAMLLISEAISTLPPDIDLEGFCQIVTQHLRTYYDAHGVSIERLRTHPEERLTASVGIYSLHHDEVWLVGDCQCLTGGRYYDNPKPEEAAIAARRARHIEAMLSSGAATIESLRSHDMARDLIVGDIVQTCHRQNVDFAVVDGFEMAREKVVIVKADPTHDIILATDGYPFLHDTLTASEAALAAQLSSDPLCYRGFQATKGMMAGNRSFDDRCYVRFRVSR